jgi:hypothetical protein
MWDKANITSLTITYGLLVNSCQIDKLKLRKGMLSGLDVFRLK